MINGKTIRRHAMTKAREFCEMVSIPNLKMLLNKGSISHPEFERMSKSQIRGSLKGMSVKFKNGDLDQMALKSLKFRELQCLLSTQTLSSFNEQMTLKFLNDCFMIDNTYEFLSTQNPIITESQAAFIEKMYQLVYGVLCDLATDFEEFYILELENKSKLNALKRLLNNEERSMNNCHEGNLPIETAMQTS